MSNVNIKTATPLAGTSIASDDRLALGDVSADAWVPVTTDTLLQALARVCSTTLVLPQNLTVRQPGGVAGTDEAQISHDGTDVLVVNAESANYVVTRSGYGFKIQNKVPATYFLYDVANGQLRASSTSLFGWSTNPDGALVDTATSRAAAKVVGITDGSTGGGTLSSVPLTPAQIAAHTNDYAPGAARYYRLSSDASRNITGLVAGVSGQECWLVNVGAQNIVIKHQDAASAEANRFLCNTGADITVAADARVSLVYDATTQRWRVYG